MEGALSFGRREGNAGPGTPKGNLRRRENFDAAHTSFAGAFGSMRATHRTRLARSHLVLKVLSLFARIAGSLVFSP
jgi:hypothetical protein